jgi:YesN/AraC family two-component response regulator
MEATKTILIIDDEESVLYVLRNSLLKIGHEYRILTATDGKNALKYLEKYQVDLVITDYRMSGMNGLELIETIANVQPDTRMILITAFGTEEIEAEAQRHNVAAYLKKPLDLNQFRQIVKRTLGDLSPAHSADNHGEEQIQLYVTQAIEQLQQELNAACVIFTNLENKKNLLAGQNQPFSIEQFTSLLSASFAIADKASHLLGNNESVSDWLIQRSSHFDIYTTRLCEKYLLSLLIETGYSRSFQIQIMSALEAAEADLHNILLDSAQKGKETLFGQEFNQAVQTELEKIFEDPLDSLPQQSAAEKKASAYSLTYEEALSLGMILPTEENTSPENQ